MLRNADDSAIRDRVRARSRQFTQRLPTHLGWRRA